MEIFYSYLVKDNSLLAFHLKNSRAKNYSLFVYSEIYLSPQNNLITKNTHLDCSVLTLYLAVLPLAYPG